VANECRAVRPRIFSTICRCCICSCSSVGTHPAPDWHSRAEWLLPVSEPPVPAPSK
jgi:hypothetical protein